MSNFSYKVGDRVLVTSTYRVRYNEIGTIAEVISSWTPAPSAKVRFNNGDVVRLYEDEFTPAPAKGEE